jgi:hypothetical protein
MMSRLMLENAEGKGLVSHEIVPEGYEQLAAEARDEDIDARIKVGERRFISCWYGEHRKRG